MTAASDHVLGLERERGAVNAPVHGIQLLGPVEIRTAGVTRRPRRAATIELVAYLALHSYGGSRDQLLEALWPASDPRLAATRLWQCVSDARRLLGTALVREHDRYLLDRSRVRVDVELLDRRLVEGERNSAVLEAAFSLFRGEPLAGIDSVWADGDRRRLEAVYVSLTEQVGRCRLERRDPLSALAVAERGLRADELNERLWRLAMQAEAEIGLRSAVARRYEWLSGILAERLGLEPEQETKALYRRLLGQG